MPVAAYGNIGAGMGELLAGMRDAAIADNTVLKYLRQCRVALGAIDVQYSEPAIVLMPVRSPRTIVGEFEDHRAVYVTHEITILCCKFAADPFNNDDDIVGNSRDRGMVGFHEDTLSFFQGNGCSVAGINLQATPAVDSQPSPYDQFKLSANNQTVWALVSSLTYKAHTDRFDE